MEAVLRLPRAIPLRPEFPQRRSVSELPVRDSEIVSARRLCLLVMPRAWIARRLNMGSPCYLTKLL